MIRTALRIPLRTCAALAVAGIALVASALTAGAHVEVAPEEAVAGTTTTLTFSFRHGKDGTATTALSVQVPVGASIVEVPAKEGWSSTLEDRGRVVTWSGGSAPDGTEATFAVVVRLPDTAGEVLFPTIQTTEAGELAWISQDEGEGEDVQPAPRLVLTPSQASSTSTSLADPSTTTRAMRDLPRTNLEAEERDGDGSPAPWLIGSGALALVSIAIGGTILKRRSS